MSEELKKTQGTSPVTPEVDETKVTETNIEDNKKGEEQDGFNYVKARVDRAKQQTENEILKELGVDSLEDAKKTLTTAQEAMDKITQLETSLAKKEQDMLNARKYNALIKLLDNHEVFDSEALSHYVDLEKVELDETGSLTDEEGIVESLKKAKPKFFGTKQTVTDGYVKGGNQQPETALDKQRKGDNVGAISDFLKANLTK